MIPSLAASGQLHKKDTKWTTLNTDLSKRNFWSGAIKNGPQTQYSRGEKDKAC